MLAEDLRLQQADDRPRAAAAAAGRAPRTLRPQRGRAAPRARGRFIGRATERRVDLLLRRRPGCWAVDDVVDIAVADGRVHALGRTAWRPVRTPTAPDGDRSRGAARHAAARRAAHPPRRRAHRRASRGRTRPARCSRASRSGRERVKTLTVEDVHDPGPGGAAVAAGQRRPDGAQPRRRLRPRAAGRCTALRALREEFARRGRPAARRVPAAGRSSASTAGAALMRRAVEHGADVVGGIPHFELTREDGVASVQFAFDAGRGVRPAGRHPLRRDRRRPRPVRRGHGRRDDPARDVAAGSPPATPRRCTPTTTPTPSRLITNIARAGLHMVTNPLDNAVLQGRFDTGPIRRGHTRVKELHRGRRQRRDRARLGDGPVVPARRTATRCRRRSCSPTTAT